jgi:cation diffusion facilitator CzcD-associated flavoprotein CzcO
MMPSCDVAILGAGPYGLAAGAHLRAIKGLDIKVFGEPMEFWKSQMPKGMFLRSPWSASHISDPANALSLDTFCTRAGRNIPPRIPLDDFVEYGLWFQSQAVPEVDRRRVERVDAADPGFRLTLSDGEVWTSQRVIIAGGIKAFAIRPQVFASLPSHMVLHSSDQRNLSGFKGKRIVVIGAGQSALECAALIHEAGGNVEVIVRESEVHWLGWRARLQRLGPIAKLLYAPTDVGPAGISQIVARPDLVKYFPRNIQNRFRSRSLRPAGSLWLQSRFNGIPITTGRQVVSATLKGSTLGLKLNDGGFREVDHILTGTGYRVNIANYSFLAPELLARVKTVDGFPRLRRGLESSIPALHFLGAPASWTFGPLMYFVAGTEYAGRALVHSIGPAYTNRSVSSF